MNHSITPKKEWIPLLDYQKYCKNQLLTHPYYGLFLKMGLGKTAIVLETLYELNPPGHVLIVAPKAIARITWINEIQKWKIPFRTKSLIVNDKGKKLSKKKRLERYEEIKTDPPTIYFISRDLLYDLYQYFPDKNWCFPIVILDESQGFKSHKSIRFKTMQKIRPWLFRLILMTGSPEPNGLMDLWAQLWLLDMGIRLGTTITAYRTTYFKPGLIVNGYPVTWKPNKFAENEIYDKISDITIAMNNTHIQLPTLTYNDIEIPMTEDEYKLYKDFAKTKILQLEEGQEIEAVNAAVLHGKLSQIASGTIYLEQGSHEYAIIHKHKLEMCEYIINNTSDNVLIAYHFYSDKEMLLSYLTEQGFEPVVFDGSPEMESNWNQKKYKIMLIQPASCGFGLNLQNGGATLIWYTLYWNLEQYEQTNARIYRQGQNYPCVIHHLLTTNTIDFKTLNALKQKNITQQNLFDAIESTIQNIKTL